MTILILSTDAYQMHRLRLDLMLEMQNRGNKVIAAAPDPAQIWRPAFHAYNVDYVQIYCKRHSLNPFEDIRMLISVASIVSRLKIDCIYSCYTKALVYGSLAAKALGVRKIYALVSGLGSILRGTGRKSTLIKGILTAQFGFALGHCCNGVFFHNSDDRDMLVKMRIISAEKCTIVNGSGVKLDDFIRAPFPKYTRFLFVGRLLRDKGIIEYVEAAKAVLKIYPNIEFKIVGNEDAGNFSSITVSCLHDMIADTGIEYVPFGENVAQEYAKCTCFVLPSYHEGTPRTTLEAMASKRPILTTSAPGCHETVIDGYNGFVVPVKDSHALAKKMIWMIEHPESAFEMGKNSLELAHEKYDVHKVNNMILDSMKL